VSKIWQNPLLSNETKILISVFFSFALGFSASFLFSAVLRGLGGGVGGWLGPLEYPKRLPWQNKQWRRFLRQYLGQRAPDDIEPPLSIELFDAQLEAIKKLPAQEALQELARLRNDEDLANLNDDEWFAWWARFHRRSLSAQDPTSRMYETVRESFYVAAFIVLFSMTFTPQLRLWWVAAVCAFWLLHFVLTIVFGFIRVRDPWGSFQSQIDFLQDRLEREKRLDEVEDSL
jgi:hypothetical protein